MLVRAAGPRGGAVSLPDAAGAAPRRREGRPPAGLVEPGVERHPLHQRERPAVPPEDGAPQLIRVGGECIVGLRIDDQPRGLTELRLELAGAPAAVARE